MLFYTTILIASLAAVLVIGLLYQAVALLNKWIFGSNKLFAAVGGFTGLHKEGAMHKAEGGKEPLSNRPSQATAWSLAKMHPVLSAANGKQTSAWPYRVESYGSAGKGFKVSRDPSRKVLKLEHVSNPFKRKVASKAPRVGTARMPVTNRVVQRGLSTNSAVKPWGW